MTQSSSKTITVHKPTFKATIKKTVKPDEPAGTSQVREDVSEVSAPIDTKSALLSLYDVASCPINNSVNSVELAKVNAQRNEMYKAQLTRTKIFYTSAPSIRPTYLIQSLKPKFLEYQKYLMVSQLDQRGIIDLSTIDTMWQQIHIVDDLIADIVRMMPAQKPVGWQLTSASKNHLQFPTVGRLRDNESIADQASINSYVLGHFGVMSYTFDRAYFVGHVIGYLFSCYYLAHLSISYGVTPLPEKTVPDYDYASLETAKMVRLLHSIDVHCKRRIYQLAVFCARLSSYKLDKHIEKMLIAEVNEFDKKQQISHLDTLLNQGIMPDMPKPPDKF